MRPSASDIIGRAGMLLDVPPPVSCADWCDEHFYLPTESSNTSGRWKTTDVQRAILNAFGNDAIERVDFFKSARFGGTKMLVGVHAYLSAHKKRNIGFYQPTASDALSFVKSEVDTSIRDCQPWSDALMSHADKSSLNTLSYKAFRGCNAYYLGAHSPNSFRRLTLDAVILDELDGMQADVGREGSPTTLSWGRVKNSVFKKQIQISTPTISEFSAIEKSAKAAQDSLEYHAECPLCHEHSPIEWGGMDSPFGFKWEGRDPSTVRHYCRHCGGGWQNSQLSEACATGYWLGPNGYKTIDGISWERAGEPVVAPRHIAFKCWSAYSPFSPWAQIIEEWYDAQGDMGKLQAFTNTTLGKTWDIKHNGTLTAEVINGLIPVDDISDVIAVTAGVDIQDDRIEVQYIGHDQTGGITVLDYTIYRGDMSAAQIYLDMGRDVLAARFQCGTRELPVINACIDTQGHHTASVHRFLVANRKSGIFIGINGNGSATYEIADKPGVYKGVRDSQFYSIGTNVLKQRLFTAIRNYDQERGYFRIWSQARLPKDYAAQLTAEKMEIRRANGLDRMVFTNEKKRRNESLDTLVYALAARAYIRTHRGRHGRFLFAD